MIERDPATVCQKRAFTPNFHLHAQTFQQPGLASEVLSQILWFTGRWQCWAGIPIPGKRHSRITLVPAVAASITLWPLCFGETFNTR